MPPFFPLQHLPGKGIKSYCTEEFQGATITASQTWHSEPCPWSYIHPFSRGKTCMKVWKLKVYTKQNNQQQQQYTKNKTKKWFYPSQRLPLRANFGSHLMSCLWHLMPCLSVFLFYFTHFRVRLSLVVEVCVKFLNRVLWN